MTEELLNDYIEAHIGAEPEILHRLYRHTHLTRLYPRMCSGHAQGRLLAMFTRMIRPHRILELGTFTGYSALCFAEAMPEGCSIDTVEIDPEYADDLRELFASSPRGADIRLHIGDARELIDSIMEEGEPVDMVFIDADKRVYSSYYEAVMRHLRPGAFILADNTLWDGKVLDNNARDPQTEGIRAFNDLVASDPRVEKAIIPIRDGLTILQVRHDF